MTHPERAHTEPGLARQELIEGRLVDALDALNTAEYHLSPYGAAPHPMAHAHITLAIHATLAAQAACQGGGR
jgi:hypothetical protein